MTTLIAWPEPIHKYELSDKYLWVSENPVTTVAILRYERTRAEAAIQRLRLLKDACEDEGHEHGRVKNGFCSCFICKALQAIGEIP